MRRRWPRPWGRLRRVVCGGAIAPTLTPIANPRPRPNACTPWRSDPDPTTAHLPLRWSAATRAHARSTAPASAPRAAATAWSITRSARNVTALSPAASAVGWPPVRRAVAASAATAAAQHGSKCPPWQCLSSPPVPPQRAPGGAGQLGAPRARPKAAGRPATASAARARRLQRRPFTICVDHPGSGALLSASTTCGGGSGQCLNGQCTDTCRGVGSPAVSGWCALECEVRRT